MNKIIIKISIFFFLITNQLIAEENIMILKLKDGDVKIELFSDVAPNHVKRIQELANAGKYDNVVFHRVIDGFMAQTGDVKFGNSGSSDFNLKWLVWEDLIYQTLNKNLIAFHMIEALYQWPDHLIQTVQTVNFLFVLNLHLF